MEIRTVIFGKPRGGQVQSGQIGRASVRTKGAFSGSGLYHYPGSCCGMYPAPSPPQRNITHSQLK